MNIYEFICRHNSDEECVAALEYEINTLNNQELQSSIQKNAEISISSFCDKHNSVIENLTLKDLMTEIAENKIKFIPGFDYKSRSLTVNSPLIIAIIKNYPKTLEFILRNISTDRINNSVDLGHFIGDAHI